MSLSVAPRGFESQKVIDTLCLRKRETRKSFEGVSLAASEEGCLDIRGMTYQAAQYLRLRLKQTSPIRTWANTRAWVVALRNSDRWETGRTIPDLAELSRIGFTCTMGLSFGSYFTLR